MPKDIEGLVLKRIGGFHYVQTELGQIYECSIRGKAKEQGIVVGDRVMIKETEADRGVVERILPRSVELIRPAVANVDQVLLVMSYNRPQPSLKLLDRLLVQIEYHHLSAVIVLNKCDLASCEIIEQIDKGYPDIGYPVIHASAKKGRGVDDILTEMQGKISVLSGPSGVGKSSLLNTLIPETNMRTQEVSEKIGRGRHTTRHAELFPLPMGGWIADTPGFSTVDTPSIKREQLADLFVEFERYSNNCRFKDCLHNKEAHCGVRQAVEKGQIMASRHQSYLTLLEEVIQSERWYK
ncbi:MAG: ribosome small subunit-dependent GTPase A [Candidatus Saccharibacteria bacterium]